MLNKRVSSDLLITSQNSDVNKIEILVSDNDVLSEHKIDLITGVIEDGDELIAEPSAISILEMIKDS